MNYYIYVQFKHLCGQSSALEICKVSWWEIVSTSNNCTTLGCSQWCMCGDGGKLEHRKLTKCKEKTYVMRVVRDWTRTPERLGDICPWSY